MNGNITSSSELSLPTVTSPETGELIKRGRIKDASALVSCYQTLFNEDLESSRKRSQVQAAADGMAPYSGNRERRTNMEGRSNINWNEMSDILEEADMPYNTILESMDIFATWPLDIPEADDPTTVEEWGQICAEEHARMLRSWPDFYPCWYQNAHIGNMDGVSFAFFEDNIDWRWKVVGLQFLKFPRRTRASVNWLDIVTCKVEMLPYELYNKCLAEDDLPEGEERYWDKQAVMCALKDAGPQGLDTSNWEEWQRSWKDNDLTWGITNTTVPVIHGFIRELDGTVSHYIAQYNPSDKEAEFLYKCEGKYGDMSELLNDYLFNVGTNGDYQSIRGLGYKLFPAVAGNNRLLCKYLDAACHEATPFLTNTSEDAIIDRQMQPYGPMVVLDDKLQFAERKASNLSTSVLPALQILGQKVSAKSAGYAPVASSTQSRTQKTKYQVEIESQQTATLSGARFTMFMTCWGRHYKNIVRRTLREGYRPEDPGGEYVAEFFARCAARGVPEQAVRSVDLKAMEINKGIGKGSAASLQQVVQVLDERLYGRLDEQGRQQVNYLLAASFAGPQVARQLVPRVAGMRPPVDATIAQMENNQMAMGMPPSFEVNQNHVVHVQKHLERLYEINGQFTQGAIGIPEAIGQMQSMWEHASNDHLPLIPPGVPEYPVYKEGLQQLGEFIVNGQKHLEAQRQREEQDALEQEEVAAIEATPPGLLASAVDAQSRAGELDALTIEEKRQELVAKAASSRQNLALKDLEIAGKALDLRKKALDLKKPETRKA